MAKPPLLLLLLSLSLLSPALAEIKTLTIASDSRPMILFEKFGFTVSGHVNISASSVSVASSLPVAPDPSRLGFFLLSDESLLQVLLELQRNPHFCVLDSRYIVLLFTFRDLSPPPHASFKGSYPVTSPNEYSLFFANCGPESRVSMEVHTELFNLDLDGSRDFLSAGQTQLPSLFSSSFSTDPEIFSTDTVSKQYRYCSETVPRSGSGRAGAGFSDSPTSTGSEFRKLIEEESHHRGD